MWLHSTSPTAFCQYSSRWLRCPAHPARALHHTTIPSFQMQTYFQKGLDNQFNGQVIRLDGFISIVLL